MKKLKTSIEIGGTLNASFDKAAKSATSKLSKVGQSIRNLEGKQNKIGQLGFLNKGIGASQSAYNQSAKELTRLQSELKKTDKPSKTLIKDFEKTKKETDKLKKALEAKRKRALALGSSLKNLGVNTSNLRHENAKLAVAMSLSQKRFDALSKLSGANLKGKLGSIARQTKNISLAFIGVASAIGGASYKITKGVAESADAIGVLSQRTGVSSKFLQEWQYIAESSGVGVDTLNKSLDTFSKKLGKARYGKGTMASDLRQADADLFDELMDTTSTEDAFEIVMKRYRDSNDTQYKAAISESTFGPLAMASFGNIDSKETDELKKKAIEFGVATKKTIDLSSEFTGNLNNIKYAAKGLNIKIANFLLPTFNRLSKKLEKFIVGQGPQFKDWALSFGNNLEVFVPKFLNFTSALGKGIGAVFSSLDKIVNLFGGWQAAAYGLSAMIGGKLIFKIYGLGKAIFTAVAAMRVLAITSMPGVIAAAVSMSSTLTGVAMTALPAVVAGIRGIGLALATTPIGLLTTGLATAATLIYANWSKVLNVFGAIKNSFKSFLSSIKSISHSLFERIFGKTERTINVKTNHKSKFSNLAKTALISAPLIASAHAMPQMPNQTKVATPQVTQHITISMKTKESQSNAEISRLIIEQIKEEQLRKSRGALHDY